MDGFWTEIANIIIEREHGDIPPPITTSAEILIRVMPCYNVV
jgi:hypothetical protein